MSLLASIGLIVSSPIVSEVVIVSDNDLQSKARACKIEVERLAADRDSSEIADAKDSVIRNFASPECGNTETIYETNLVHRRTVPVGLLPVDIAVRADGVVEPEHSKAGDKSEKD